MKNQTIKTFKNVNEFKSYLSDLKKMPTYYNRIVNKSHVSKLVHSIRELGLQRAVVVLKTNVFDGELNNYIIDGQHLAEAILMSDDSDIKNGMIVFENNISHIKDIIPFVSSTLR